MRSVRVPVPSPSLIAQAVGRHQRATGVAFVVISAAAFGALPIFARLAYAAGSDPVTVLFLRFSIASVVMAGIMALTQRPWPEGRTLLALVAMGGLGYFSVSFAYFTALTLAAAGLVALLQYLYPVFVTVLSAVVFRERLSPVKIGALALALVGTVLTIGPTGGGQPLGIALAVAAGAIYAVYIVVGGRVMRQAGAIPASAVVMISAAAVFAVTLALRPPVFPTNMGGWAAIVAIALVSTVLPIIAFFAGLKRVGPVDTATLSTLEPVVVVVLAALVLNENIGTIQVVGGATILGAVILLARASE